MLKERSEMFCSKSRVALVVGLLALCPVGHLQALELEPGLYRNAPAGLNALALGYAYTGGNILTDDSQVPITDAKAHLQGALMAYARYFNLFGKMARADAATAVAWGHYEGNVNGTFLTRDPHGLADPRFRLTVNLAGAPALDRAEFKNYKQHTIWGMSLMMAPPLGQYDSSRLINLGSNRFSFRPETGLSTAWKNWVGEIAGGAWFFTTNHDYYGGKTLTQKPIEYIKGDIIYSFNRRAWLSFAYGLGYGGETSVNGVSQADLQTNHRLGGSFTYALSANDSISVRYDDGLVTRTGADFRTVATIFAHTWGR
jgi:hypothetical protein